MSRERGATTTAPVIRYSFFDRLIVLLSMDKIASQL